MPWRRLEREGYSSYSLTTSVLDEVGGQRHASAALYPRGKHPRYPLYRRLGGPSAGVDTEDRGKILCPCRGSNPVRPVVQIVVRHYTDWANRVPFMHLYSQGNPICICTRLTLIFSSSIVVGLHSVCCLKGAQNKTMTFSGVEQRTFWR
jgi:hypothetical protein